VKNPKVNIAVTYAPSADKSNTEAAQEFPLIQLPKAEIINPNINFIQVNGHSNGDTLRLHLADAYFSTGVYSSGNQFNLRNLTLQASTLLFNKNDSLRAGLNTGGKLNMTVGDFFLYKKAPDVWKFSEAAVTLTNAEMRKIGDSTKRDTVLVPSFGVKHFAASANTVKDWRKLVLNQPELQLQNISIRYRNGANIFTIDSLNSTLGSNRITMASFLYHPQLGEADYIKAHEYETDFIRTKTGRLTIYDFDRQAFIEDSAIRIRHISIDNVDFRDTRDKTPPFKANVIKPLPAGLIRKIPFDLTIDSLTLQHAAVEYKEVSEKTGEAGTIYFSNVHSRFVNLKSRNHTSRDTFEWHSDAYMIDSIRFYMGLRTAYLDSLDKLYLTVRLHPADITPLNPFFAPLASMKFGSAKLDTLVLQTVANDYISHGTMQFYYRNLKMEFVNPEDTAKKGILKSVITFLANTILIKSKNNHRIGTVYFERIRDRSIFNYIVKMVFSGMKSSIGVARSKKLEKQYQKKLTEMGWKPLED
jgi:hypothetical protein